jgi:signal transduction histidine kinase
VRIVAVAAAFAGAFGVIVAAEIVRSPLTEDRGIELAVISVLGGWSFAAAGVVAARREGARLAAMLMVAIGIVWLVRGLEWAADLRVRSVALLLGWAWAALLIHLALILPSGRLAGRPELVAVVAGYVLALGLRAAWIGIADQHVLYVYDDDPSLGLIDCDRCPTPLTVLGPHPELALTLRELDQVLGATLAANVCVLLAWRWRRGSAAQRTALAPVIAAVTGTGVVVAIGAILYSAGMATAGRVFEWTWKITVALLPAAFLAGLVRARLGRAIGVTRLISDLDAPMTADQLSDALAKALGDDTISIAYWVPDRQQYVAPGGLPIQLPTEASGRAVTKVDLDGRPIAAIIHDPALRQDSESVRAAGRATMLWLEWARVVAERNARLVELRQSRARLVDTADAERRRIERDLHDGAQQRLSALLLHMQLRRRDLADLRDADALLDDVEQGLAAGLGDLRALAAGILPPVLTDHGLPAAIEELTAGCPMPIEIVDQTHGRLPERLEAAGYFVVAEAITNVIKHARATRASVRVRTTHDTLIVEVDDDGAGGADPLQGTGLRGLVDRVGALDGTLTCTSPADGGTQVRAEIPCGS